MKDSRDQLDRMETMLEREQMRPGYDTDVILILNNGGDILQRKKIIL